MLNRCASPIARVESVADVSAEVFSFRRSLCCTLGVFFVGVGIVGVLLPGIPTVGPLMVASYFLGKSHPRLEKKLLGLPVFRNYVQYLDGSVPLPTRARVLAVVMMWGSILSSCFLLHLSSDSGWIFMCGLLLLGFVGSVVIFLIRR